MREKERKLPKSEISDKCVSTFQSYGMTEKNIALHLLGIRHLHQFMEERGYDSYTRSIGEEFYNYVKDMDRSFNYKKIRWNSMTMLNLVLDELPYSARFKKKEEMPIPDTKLGMYVKAYAKEAEEMRYSRITIYERKYYATLFATLMYQKGLEPDSIKDKDILSILGERFPTHKTGIQTLRHFFSFLYKNGHTKRNLKEALEGFVRPVKEKVLSFYSPEEIGRIESAVLRTSPVGKRDYAIILLGTRLGLRSSDIRMLKLSNIDWDKSTIHIKQYKTGKEIELPLLSDVGDALADYILHARPQTNLKTVFVTAVCPYKELETTTISSLVGRAIGRAGIEISNRHHGSHCLRHSLATSMLAQGVNIPTISECLGHSSTDSTMCYLGVDVKAMLECSLEVPPVPDLYYVQKGGAFYA